MNWWTVNVLIQKFIKWKSYTNIFKNKSFSLPFYLSNDEFCENKLDAPYLYLYYMCTNDSVKHRTLYEICNGIINC